MSSETEKSLNILSTVPPPLSRLERVMAVKSFVRKVRTALSMPTAKSGLDISESRIDLDEVDGRIQSLKTEFGNDGSGEAAATLDEIKSSLDVYRAELDSLAAAMPLSGKNALKAVNGRIHDVERSLAMPLGLRFSDLAKARERRAELEGLVATQSKPKAAPLATAVATPPAPIARPFEPSGDTMVDAAVKAAGCHSLDHYKALTKRNDLAALVEKFPARTVDGEASRANLARAEAELRQFTK
jgi:hypothetical protein